MKKNNTTKSEEPNPAISTNGHVKQEDISEQKNKGKSIKDVFEEELKDIYGAEKQLIKALPDIIKAASSQELKDALKNHLEETKEQAKRLEKIFGMLSIDREAKKCEAMEGLIEEANQIVAEFEEGSVRDCALIVGSQKIEHYEIAAYGSLCEFAEVMGKHKIAEMLDEILEEEETADMLLTEIAEQVNDEAMEGMEN